MRALISDMTLQEKIGQLNQLDASHGYPPEYLADRIRAGHVGSVLNNANVDIVNELQRLAAEESRLGIPLLVGRDVIHGFQTVMPIPVGQAASWNPEVVEAGARAAALEASRAGINWTFAPMIDISRDARWGRIAESLGEDPYLAGELGAAMVRGFQTDDLTSPDALGACAKHFAGYGAAESGRDYATTNVPHNEMRNIYLRPFKAAVDAGVMTLMTSFSDIDGIPATANDYLLRDILRDEWSFDGMVVSDWDSVRQLEVHGLTENDRESAFEAFTAGVDMEMTGESFFHHLAALIEEGRVSITRLDNAVANILRAKFRLGLFDRRYTENASLPRQQQDWVTNVAKDAALQSIVMLKNDHDTLPLRRAETASIALLGPLADAPYQQLGTWIFDGDHERSITPRHALESMAGDDFEVNYLRTLDNSRSRDTHAFAEAVETARQSDVVVLCLGEESILSGEAHSRANIDLPGAQAELVRAIRETGKPVVAVIMAGRPLTLSNIVDEVDAILFAWHPGTMGGQAIAELLFGVASPCGKLPATFPRMVGQIPIYYNQKHTGKPPTYESIAHIDELDSRAPQTSLGMSAYHLDAGFTPLYPFGHGLSYGRFAYSDIRVSQHDIPLGGQITLSAQLTNEGQHPACEVAQLYVRDLVGSVTRPIKELKGFQRQFLQPGETVTVQFTLHTDDLAFYGRRDKLTTEPGAFHAWIGGSSDAELWTEFRIV